MSVQLLKDLCLHTLCLTRDLNHTLNLQLVHINHLYKKIFLFNLGFNYLYYFGKSINNICGLWM